MYLFIKIYIENPVIDRALSSGPKLQVDKRIRVEILKRVNPLPKQPNQTPLGLPQRVVRRLIFYTFCTRFFTMYIVCIDCVVVCAMCCVVEIVYFIYYFYSL